MRRTLYTLTKILGDINAVKKGKVGRRIARRQAGKLMNVLLALIISGCAQEKPIYTISIQAVESKGFSETFVQRSLTNVIELSVVHVIAEGIIEEEAR